MKIITFYVNKGGAGKSTLTFSVACAAAAGTPKLKTILIGCDPQGDSIRWSQGPDRLLEDPKFTGKVEESPFGFDFLFLPKGFNPQQVPNAQAYQLILVDLPPFVESIRNVKPNIWMIPIKDIPSLMNTAGAVQAMQRLGGQVVFIPNGFADGDRSLEKLQLSLYKFGAGTTTLNAIPFSPCISKTATEGVPPWATSHSVVDGRPRIGAAAVLKATENIIRMAGVPNFSVGSVLRAYYDYGDDNPEPQQAPQGQKQK